MNNKRQTAVEWLAEKLNYVTWMRNRDEISAGLADEWRKHYLLKAKEMEQTQINEAFEEGYVNGHNDTKMLPSSHYNQTYNTSDK